MDEDNPPPSRPYRIRRASSSLISSTTSPMFSAPPTPTLQPPPSPMAHHSRHRQNNNTGAISQNVSNNNFGPGDIDDDVQPSSSSSSFPPPSPRLRVGGSAGAGSSSSFSRNSGPQSPLSSPDSTFWGGAASSPSPVMNSYRNPPTPGGMCAVSSSTMDDVPPSPFSPAEDISNHSNNGATSGGSSASLNSVNNLLNNSLMGPVAGPSNGGHNSANNPNNSNNTNNGGVGNSASLPLVHHRISQLIVGNGGASSGNSGSSSVGIDRQPQQHSALISQLNQEVNHGESNHPSTSSSSSLTFSLSPSPLMNKIKKAASFERFSQAQATSSSSRSSGASATPSSGLVSNESFPNPTMPSGSGNGANISAIISSHQNSNNTNEQSISLPMSAASTSSSTTSSSAIVSRINWEPVVSSPSVSVSAASGSSSSAPPPSSSLSFRLSQNTNFGDKSHIKIPSKKLAAKLASVFEQEQLNEAAAAMGSASATLTNVITPSTSSAAATALGLSHHSGTSSSSSVVQSYLNASSQSQSGTGSGSSSHTSTTNSTLSQILNEAPAHHISMGSLVTAAEEQIMNQGGVHNVSVSVSSHENLMRELSESPLNLTESSNNSSSNSTNNNNSSSHHHHHHHSNSQSQTLLPHRNPVISSRASISNSSSSVLSASTSPSNSSMPVASSSLLSKKIPLTPKQKVLHRIQSGAMSPPLEPQPQPPPQQQVISIQHQLQQPPSPPQNVQQLSQQYHQASMSSALSNMQSANNLQSANMSLVQEQMTNANTNNQTNNGHLILSSGGPHSPSSQLDAYSYDALLRAREDLVVQELGKIIEDPSNVNNMPYDTPEAYAYYQSILSDEIFAPGGGSTQGTSRTIQQQMSGGLQDPNDDLQQSHQGQIEFVLGIPSGDESHRGRADDLSLGNDGGQQQFLDPNDALAAIKSHNQTESTLRNLLMMTNDSNRHSEDAWLLAECQNRLLSGDFNSRSSSIRNGIIAGNGNVGGLNSSVLSINALPTSMGTTWNNDSSWQRTSWQHQGAVDQDEVMDMSMMEPERNNSGNGTGNVIITKRLSQMHAGGYSDQDMDDVNLVSDRDLANGLLQNIPISMPMDLQQPLGLLQSSNASANSLKHALLSSQAGANGIPLDLQHHKMLSGSGSGMDMDDQPVNLMAAVNLEQELSHHSDSVHHHHHHHQQHSAAHLLPHHLAEVKSLSHAGNNGDHSSQQNGGSYTLQIHQQPQHIQNDFHQHQLVEVSNLSPVLDNNDERRIIRVKKNKDNIPLDQEEMATGLLPQHFIPDKPVQPKSYASLPHPLQLVKVGNGDEIAVCTRNKPIPINTRFGPVEGSLKKACTSDMDIMNSVYPCLIMTDQSNILWKVDREEDDCCNWMKFVRMAHSIKDQNALVSEGEHGGLLYFTTCKEIPPRTELQVGFSLEYAQKYGLPYLLPFPNSSNTDDDTNDILDDQDKITLSSIHQQSNSIMNAAASVIHGSQNFLAQQQHQLGKSIIEDSITDYHHHQNQAHAQQSASTSPETTSSVLPQQKSVIVETYQCFECDQEFSEIHQLEEHLDKMHKEPEIRRPKKKAIKKYQQSQQSLAETLTVSTTAASSTPMDVIDVSFSSALDRNGNDTIQISSHQSGKVDSSSQNNTVDSSDPMATGNLPMTKKRKAASSINAMNAKTSSLSTSSSISTIAVTAATTTSNSDSMNESSTTYLKTELVVSNSNLNSDNSNCSMSINGNSMSSHVDGNDSDVTTGQPPAKVKCTMCYKSFATKERLDRHMIVHSDEDTKPLKCPFCPKRFLTNSALAGHIKTHAEEGKCFECPMCQFSTQQLLQLKEHVQTHKSRDSGMFHCPQCPKKFSAYSMIRKHIRAFHGPRQYECEQCPMSFPTCDKLKLHKLKHSDHREFLCAECGRQFKRKDKLREHTKRIHETKRKAIELTIPKDKIVKKFVPKVSPEEYERFVYKCSECMVGFKRRGMLVNHLAKRHPEKPPQQVPELNMPIVRPTRNYFCLYCERVYKSSSKRKAHIIKAHPGKPIPPQARNKDIPQQITSYIDSQPLQPGTLVHTLTDDGNNTARAGVVSSAVSSSRLGSATVSTSTIAAVVRRETVVGKVVANPHGCPWCHRQYATRAKLLQHQRKAHIHLMPLDMQLPRTQKNNVMRKDEKEVTVKTEQDSVISSNVSSKTDNTSKSKGTTNNSSSTDTLAVTQSTTSTIAVASSSGTSTIQAEGVPFQTEEGLVGILVTPVGSNVELGNLVQGDVPIMMLTTQTVDGSSATTLSALQGVNFSVLQAGQVTNLNNSSNNNGTNASPNIISISNTASTATTTLDSSTGLISGSGNNSTARLANVIQHHQSSSNSNSNNHLNSDNCNGISTTSSSGGVISATGKL